MAVLAAAGVAVVLAAGLPNAATSAAGQPSAAPKARTDHAPARRCRGHRGARRARCARIRRLASRSPAPERLTPVELAPRSPAGGGGGPAPEPGPGGDPGESPALARFVSVAAREWSLTLSRPVVGDGKVTVELQNDGEDPHNLIVSPDDGSHSPLAGWPELEPGSYLRQSVTLEAGRYLLWCSLEGHEAAGMSVRLRVDQDD